MAHNDIYKKFLIEYDKANVTSSYPSLTEEEAATILDKAYNALLAQKVTGNNTRRSTFESDIKSISDLQPLVKNRLLFLGNDSNSKKGNNMFPSIDNLLLNTTNTAVFDPECESVEVYNAEMRSMPDNMRSADLPYDFLYFVTGGVPVDMHSIAGWKNNQKFGDGSEGKPSIIHPIDNKTSDYPKKHKIVRFDPMRLMPHQLAEQFYATSYNIPWVKNPVCFLENKKIFILVDPVASIPDLEYYDYKTNQVLSGEWASITYVKTPNTFVKDTNAIKKSISLDYQVDDSIEIVFTLDKYNMKEKDSYNDESHQYINEKEIHVNNISMKYPDETDPDGYRIKKYVYYAEVNGDYDTSTITASSFINMSFQGVKYSGTGGDDSCNLQNGHKLVFVGYHDTIGCSKFFTVSYDDLYQMLLNSNPPKISGENDHWEADDAQDSVEVDLDETHSFVGADQYEMGHEYNPLNLDINMFNYSYVVDNVSEDVSNLPVGDQTLGSLYTFELNDTMADELVQLAITFALENVESTRLNSHVQLNGLES